MTAFPNTHLGLFYFFIKTNASDLNLLQKLGLKNHRLIGNKAQLIDDLDDLNHLVFATKCKNWTHLIDSWSCDLWISIIENPDYLNELSKNYEIFTCMIGDADESVNFHYYQNGHLVRKYIYDEDIAGNITQEEYFGEPLAGEDSQYKHLNFVLNIAKSIGINLHHLDDKIKCYLKD